MVGRELILNVNNKGAPPCLKDLSLGRTNNFDFLRFFAAALIILTHSYALSHGDHSKEILHILTNGLEDFGTVALKAFFIISGFLITQSYERTNDILIFFKSRALRIFPGLIFVVFMTTFILGPLVTKHSAADYFSDFLTYKYLLSVFLIKIQVHLPGVFENNIYKGVVNGSLWTLLYEFGCYIVVGLLGITEMLKKRVVLAVFITSFFLHFLDIDSFTLYHSLYFLTYFMSGAVLYMYREYIYISSKFAVVCVILLCISSVLGALKVTMPMLGTYIIIYLAYNPKIKLNSFASKGDFSYGLYIFGFPIQQLIVQRFGGSMNSYLNFVISFPLVLACAFISWHLIEKECLKLKHYDLTGRMSKGYVLAHSESPDK